MKTNVGSIDQAIRIALGVVLILLAATCVVGLWGYIGIVLVLTGLVRFCPAYALFGIKTCPATPPGKQG